MMCINCGNELRLGADFCLQCGTKQDTLSLSCKFCGQAVSVDDNVCPNCGESFEATNNENTAFNGLLAQEPDLEQNDNTVKSGPPVGKIIVGVILAAVGLFATIGIMNAALTPTLKKSSIVDVNIDRGLYAYLDGYSSTQLTLELTWDGMMSLPRSYQIEKNINGVWYEHGSNISFDSRKTTYPWGDEYYEVTVKYNTLQAGNYRCVFSYSYDNGRFYQAVDFTIK